MLAYERYANCLTIVLFIALTGVAIAGVIVLPDSIPIHFNRRGEPNRWGSPTTLLILPIINGCILGLFLAIQRYTPTYLMNFPGPRTPDNMALQRQNLNQLIATMRVLITGLFLGIAFQMGWGTMYFQQQGNLWPSYLFIALMLVSVTFYIIRSYRLTPRQ